MISNSMGGGGALEVGDLRLLEDGGECGGALTSDAVEPDTAKDGLGMGGGTVREQVRLSAGADRKASMRGGGALERGHGAPLERLAQLGDALCSVGAAAPPIDAAKLVLDQAAKERRSVLSMGADTKVNTRDAAAHT